MYDKEIDERALNMDFLSNMQKFLTNTTEIVVQKTGELVETSKVKYSIFDIRNDIEKICTEIGEKIYEGYRNEENVAEFIEEKCLEIDKLNEKMELLKKKLQD